MWRACWPSLPRARVRAAGGRLDRARPAEVGERAVLGRSKHGGAHDAEISERVFGVGAPRAVTEDRRIRQQFDTESGDISINDHFRAARERSSGRSARFGALQQECKPSGIPDALRSCEAADIDWRKLRIPPRRLLFPL